MIALSWIAFLRRLRGDVRHCLTSIAILTGGALFIAAAAGFAVAGGFLWLSAQMPGHLAALVVASALFLVGAITISIALVRNRRPLPKPDASGPTTGASADMVSQKLIQAAVSEVTKMPVQAVLAAVALGVVVGLLRTRKST